MITGCNQRLLTNATSFPFYHLGDWPFIGTRYSKTDKNQFYLTVLWVITCLYRIDYFSAFQPYFGGEMLQSEKSTDYDNSYLYFVYLLTIKAPILEHVKAK